MIGLHDNSNRGRRHAKSRNGTRGNAKHPNSKANSGNESLYNKLLVAVVVQVITVAILMRTHLQLDGVETNASLKSLDDRQHGNIHRIQMIDKYIERKAKEDEERPDHITDGITMDRAQHDPNDKRIIDDEVNPIKIQGSEIEDENNSYINEISDEEKKVESIQIALKKDKGKSRINNPSKDEKNERNKESIDLSKKKERMQRDSINGGHLAGDDIHNEAIQLTTTEDLGKKIMDLSVYGKKETRTKEITEKGKVINRVQQDLNNENHSIEAATKTENQITTQIDKEKWQTKQATNDKTYSYSGRTQIEALWKGSGPYGKITEFNRIILVLSGCDEHLHWLLDFTKGFAIQQVNIFTKCNTNIEDLNHTVSSLHPSTDVVYHPFVGGPVLAFSRWISSSLSTLNNDDVVVFLKGDYHFPYFKELRIMEHRHSRRRSLSELLQATSTYDFGCLAEITGWSDADMSTYHTTDSVMAFRSKEIRNIESMEDWLQFVNVSLPHPLTSVCYGGEFAVTAKRIKTRGVAFWREWEEKVEKTIKMSVHSYAERSWAGMFTLPLSEADRTELLRYTTGMSLEETFDGALLHHEVLTTGNRPEVSLKNEFPDHAMDELIDAIWTGDTLDGNSSRFDRVFVVISHCNNPLRWYNDFVKDVEIYQTIIYSKCSADLPDIKSASFETLEDVGRADHTFAHFMANLPTDISDNDVIVFLQDNIISDGSDSTFESRSLHDMLRIASGKGFGCRLQFKGDFSAYHSEAIVSSFNHDRKELSVMKQKNPGFLSSFKTLGDWLHSVNGCLPSPSTEVCYGGGFAVDAIRIKRREPKFWKDVKESLSRGRDIEESHFAERSWAGLLSKPLSADSLMLIRNNEKVEVKEVTPSITGVLTREVSNSFLKSVEAEWRGDAIGGDPYSFDRLFMVLSFCQDDFRWLNGFIHQFDVHDFTIYSRCEKNLNHTVINIPDFDATTVVNVKGSSSEHHVYAHWMAEVSSKLNNNDGVIFLKDNPIHPNVILRSLKEMLRIASVTGFGCMVEYEEDYSAYSAYEDLSGYRPTGDVKNPLFESNMNMGDWIRSLNVTPPTPYMKVCYEGNFAVKASQIKKYPTDMYESIEKSLSRLSDTKFTKQRDWLSSHNIVSKEFIMMDNIQENIYAELSWAALFSEPLSGPKTTAIKNMFSKSLPKGKNKRLVGTLTRVVLPPFYSEIEPTWRGDAHGGDPSVFRRIFVVVSHCANKLDIVNEFIKGVEVDNVIVYSKCIAPPIGAPKNATLLRLPNVGRCDNTYAHWMATMSSTLDDDDAVVFMKDTQLVHQMAKTRNLTDMLRIASVSGFGCWLELTEGLSSYHLVSELNRFQMILYRRTERDSVDNFYSNFNDLGHWLSSIGGDLPEPFTQVCYGGNFAVKASQIKLRPPEFWSAMAKSLSRGDNIQEGHYAERAWAGLLAKPLSKDNMKKLHHYWNRKTHDQTYRGALGLLLDTGMSLEVGALWKGDTVNGNLSVFRRVFLVISHCRHSLSWLPDFLNGFLIHKTTIYSKCGKKPDYVPPNTTITKLPNVGGHHHTYSHWMANIKPGDIADTDAIVFLTDVREIKNLGRPRSFNEMLNIASHSDFGCWLTPMKARDFVQSDISVYHSTTTLLSFQANGAKIGLKTWVKYMHLEMPLYFINVCYGGNFVVKGSQIKSIKKSSYENITRSLEYRESAPEEQYAERIWGGIFHDIDNNHKFRIQKSRTGRLEQQKYKGALFRVNN